MKPKIKDVVKYFEKLYPIKFAEEWDKVGHKFGDIDAEVKTIVVALDLTPSVFQMAILHKSNLIITHHPFIFNDDIDVDYKEAPYKKSIMQKINSRKMSVLTLHTNYDFVKKTTATQIANFLNIKPIKSTSNYGHIFQTPINSKELNGLLDKKLGLKINETNVKNKNKIFSKWGLLPGSGSPVDIIDLAKQGAELIITSDIKWSTWNMAKIENIKLIEVSHAIEDVFTDHVSKLINKKWKKIDVMKKNILNLT